MPKNPKSIVVSYRLSPLVIAKAIDGLKNYDKSADISKISSIIKQTTLHGINYLTNALPWEPSEQSQVIVHNLTTQGKQGKQGLSIEQSILKQPLYINIDPAKPESEETSYFDIKAKEEREKKSLSSKSTVMDFSMPEELKQELEDKD